MLVLEEWEMKSRIRLEVPPKVASLLRRPLQ